MNCQDVARCADLNACSATGANLSIGSLASGFEPYSGEVLVRLTNITLDRITDFDNASTAPDISIDTDDFQPVVGHTYRVEVIGEEGGGSLDFHVYEWDTTANARDLTTSAYDSATVRFVRSHDALGNVNEYSQAWLTL